MALTPQDIARIANLARLELQPAESERMLTQLNGFFDIVEKMRAVDTTGLELMRGGGAPNNACPGADEIAFKLVRFGIVVEELYEDA